MGTKGLHADTTDGVLYLTLDNEPKRNSMSDQVVRSLTDAIERAGQDQEIRVIVMQGAGDDFCSGIDIIARNQGTDARPRAGSIQRRLPYGAHRLISTLLTVQTPVVCKVRGWAAGIGLHMVLAADFAIAAEDALLWEPFGERGLSVDSAGGWLLPRRIGDTRAREMLLLGRRVSGKEAGEWGLVHRAVSPDQLEPTAIALIADLKQRPTVALGLTKWLLHSGATSHLDEHLRNEAFALELAIRTKDFREGLAAFRDKRDPTFLGE